MIPPSPPKRSRHIQTLAFLVGAGILPLSILSITYAQQGFVAAGRAATALVLPVGLVWVILWAATVVSSFRGQRTHAIRWFALFLIWSVLGNSHIASAMMKSVEMPVPTDQHPAFEKRGLGDRVDAVVTLGGAAGLVADGFPEVSADGERLISAAQAYHAGMTTMIITTGSSTDGIGNPSEVGQELLVSLGVPADRIYPLGGVNTMAEMESLARFLDEPPLTWRARLDDPNQPRIGLITSAYHMPRALRLASQHDLKLQPMPCAFRISTIERPAVASDWIPNAENQATVGKVIKEAIAWIVGR